ncbi:MAG: metalloprotease TldD [Dongiaceae bacterium]
MSLLRQSDEVFFAKAGLSADKISSIVRESLHGADDGELYLEYRLSESLSFDDGQLKAAAYDTTQGFGLRSVKDELAAYAHSSDLSEEAIKRAAQTVAAVKKGYQGNWSEAPIGTNARLYKDTNPLAALEFAKKVALLQEIDAYARAQDPRVKQVSAGLSGEYQVVQIIRPDGRRYADIRPLVRIAVAVVVADQGKMESGSYGMGGRQNYEFYIAPERWRLAVKEALRQALVKWEAKPAPAGEMPVVLGPGWPGILLHEAIGHGFEGDFIRKNTSVFSGLQGEMIAADGVTVVDDGTIPDRRGSITIDDEGTPSQRNVLVENGKLVGFLQDRQSARLLGVRPTGNGRRESFAHLPMPRMTNTYMLSGKHAPEEAIRQVKKGLYAPNFGGGQVDITSGKFVFSASEAYMIENGKIRHPVKGATLVGSGKDALKHIKMVCNDSKLDEGIGTCGKDGQSVPVGVGQPTLLIEGITVGGTAA